MFYQQNNIEKEKNFIKDLDILKELIQSCDKMSLKIRKSNKNIKQNGCYFIMLDKNIENIIIKPKI